KALNPQRQIGIPQKWIVVASFRFPSEKGRYRGICSNDVIIKSLVTSLFQREEPVPVAKVDTLESVNPAGAYASPTWMPCTISTIRAPGGTQTASRSAYAGCGIKPMAEGSRLRVRCFALCGGSSLLAGSPSAHFMQ